MRRQPGSEQAVGAHALFTPCSGSTCITVKVNPQNWSALRAQANSHKWWTVQGGAWARHARHPGGPSGHQGLGRVPARREQLGRW